MPGLKHEKACLPPVAGVDEAGRGPLAGPVVAAAVVLPAKGVPRGIDDSKKLSAAERARLCGLIQTRAVWGLGVVESAEIDTLNIYWATMKVMTLAVDALTLKLGCDPGHVLVDGNRLPRWSYPATAIVSGDAHSLSIAAASILAKETRDAIMLEHAAVHPHYHWHSNKGYGCKHHLAALLEHGPTPIHRRSFAPVAAAYARITPDAAAGPLFTASAANQFHG